MCTSTSRCVDLSSARGPLRRASAVVYVPPAPMVKSICPAQAVGHATPASVVECVSPALAVSSAPALVMKSSCDGGRLRHSSTHGGCRRRYSGIHLSSASESYVALKPTMQAAPAPILQYIAPTTAVIYAALAPTVLAAPAPVVEYISPAPAENFAAPLPGTHNECVTEINLNKAGIPEVLQQPQLGLSRLRSTEPHTVTGVDMNWNGIPVVKQQHQVVSRSPVQYGAHVRYGAPVHFTACRALVICQESYCVVRFPDVLQEPQFPAPMPTRKARVLHPPPPQQPPRTERE